MFIDVPTWTTQQVIDWLKGLDEVLDPHIASFEAAAFSGKQLLCLSSRDLEALNITKLGHQELILEAVELLSELYYELDSDTVQSLALRLGCKTLSLANEIKALLKRRDSKLHNGGIHDASTLDNAEQHNTKPEQRIPLFILPAISDIVKAVKNMTSWLDRPPFDGSNIYMRNRNKLIKLSVILLNSTHSEQMSTAEEVIMKTCYELSQVCDSMVRDIRDPLCIQPASLEVATIRKKPEEELGLFIQSSYNGVHCIEKVKPQSPAETCGKIVKGDEVVQVNHRAVIGWKLQSLVDVLKENQKGVVLTLKKRPHHVNLVPPRAQRKNRLNQAIFPNSLKRRSSDKRASRKSDYLQPPNQAYIDSSNDDTEEDSLSCDDLLNQSGGSDLNGDVFTTTGGHEVLTVETTDGKQRRATVSGASPTLSRTSVTITVVNTEPIEAINISTAISTKDRQQHIATTTLPQQHNDDGAQSQKHRTSPSLSHTKSVPTHHGKPSLSHTKSTPCDKTPKIVSSKKSSDMKQLKSQPVISTTLTNQGSKPRVVDSEHVMSSPVVMPTHVVTHSRTQSVPYDPRRKSHEHTRTLSHAKSNDGFETLLNVQDSPQKRSKSLSSVVAGMENSEIQLMGVKRIAPQSQDQDSMHLADSDSELERRSSIATSYRVNVVGGVPQKFTQTNEPQSPTQSPATLLRRKFTTKRFTTNRRISCKDLGKGDCQGWLWKKREGNKALSSKWSKRFFVLKEDKLYYYKDPEDDRAQGTLYLPVFKVSPAPEIKSKKYAFKAYHSGTTFYFASERQEDRGKWMNKMGLAAISYDASHDDTTAGFIRPSNPSSPTLSDEYYFSESDGETDSTYSSTPNSPSSLRNTLPRHQHPGVTPTISAPHQIGTPTISAPQQLEQNKNRQFTPSPSPSPTPMSDEDSLGEDSNCTSRSRKARLELDFQLSSPHSVKSNTLSPTKAPPPRPTRYATTPKRSPAKNPRTKFPRTPAITPPTLQRRGTSSSDYYNPVNISNISITSSASTSSGESGRLGDGGAEPLYGNLMCVRDDEEQGQGHSTALDDAIPADSGDDDDQFHQLYRDIKSADLFIDGNNKKTRRTSTLSPSKSEELATSDDVEVLRKISCMERTLKAKELELKAIDAFLSSDSITPSLLTEFKSSYANLVENIHDTSSSTSNSSDEDDTEVFNESHA